MQIKRIHTKLFFACLLWVSSVNIEAQSLIAVLDSVEHQYNVSFAYNSDYLANIDWEFPSHKLSLQEILDRLSEEKKLEYKLVNNQKILLRKSSPTQNYTLEAKVQGKLVDISTGQPLPYAAIYTDDLQSGTTSDDNGVFELNFAGVKSGYINFQYLGYQPKRIPAANLAEGGTIFLAPAIQLISPITIAEHPVALTTMNPQMVKIAKSYFNNSTSSLLGNDPIAGLKNIAGFMAYDDFSASAGFRGSAADANLYMLDDIPLIQVDHFFGIFSSIQESMVDKIDLYKNNWPIEFGGRTSALIDIQTINQDSLSGGLAINNLTSELSVNIPLGTFGKILIAGRTTNSDISNTSFFDFLYKNNNTQSTENARNRLLSINPSFRFNDYYLKGTFNLGVGTILTVKKYASADKFNYDFNRVFLLKTADHMRLQKEQYEELSSWDNQAWGVSLDHQWNSTWKSSWILNKSSYYFDEDINIQLSNPERPVNGFKVRVENKFSNQVQQMQAQWNNELNFNKDYSFKFGYQLNAISALVSLDQDQESLLSIDLSSNQHTVFGSFHNQPYSKMHWSFGGRLTYDEHSQTFLTSPRFQANYLFNDYTQIKSSIAYYEQTMRQTNYEDRFNRSRSIWILANNKIPKLSTINNMIGFSHSKNGLGIDAELYYKVLNGITEFALTFPHIASGMAGQERADPQLKLYNGVGRAYGLDLTFSFEFEKLQSQLAYSLSKAEQTVDELNQGNAYPSQDDRRHQVKLLNTFSLGKWNLYANFTYASGKPYLDLTNGQFINTPRPDIPLDKFMKRLNPYQRLDIGIDYQFNITQGVFGEIGLSVFNVLNHDNEAYRQNVYAIENTNASAVFGNSIQMLGATPSIQFKLKF